MSLIIVMGAPGSGKTSFIQQHFPKYQHFAIADYQKEIRKAMGNPEQLEVNQYRALIAKANELMLQDVVEAIANGNKEIVIEHTLYKAKRRILLVDEIRQVTEDDIRIYVMKPSKECLQEIEIPNRAEGFAKIYCVTEEQIEEVLTSPDLTLVERCRKELDEEKKKQAELAKEAEECKRILEEIKTKPFWHYCEVCGKKELLTGEEAFHQGWDYPPYNGQWGVVSPRTCGDCLMKDTVYWKLASEHLKVEELNEQQKRVLLRILREPFNVMEED